MYVAPSSAPSTLTLVSKSATRFTVNWTYSDTADVDGYVVYVSNSTAHNVVSSENTSITVYGLMPGTSYSITVRAYQDILGPPSTPLIVTLTESTPVTVTSIYTKGIHFKYSLITLYVHIILIFI